MTIATVIEASDRGIRIFSCPAVHLRGFAGSLTLWPLSEKPIRVPYAWVYSLSFKDSDA